MSRKYTNRLLELVEDGSVDKESVIHACLDYMSEDDVKDMMIANDFGSVDEIGHGDYSDFNDPYDDNDDDDDY